MLEAEGERVLEVLHELGSDSGAAGGPNGEDRGETGHGAPLFDDVVQEQRAGIGKLGGCCGGDEFAGIAAVRVGSRGDREAQGGIADEQRGV